MEIQEIFAKAREIRDRAKSVDQKLKELFTIISPSNYPPFVEFDEFTGFIQGVSAVNQEIGEQLAWYFWEITIDVKQVWEIKYPDGRVYGIKDDETFLAFLISEYGEK